MSLRDVVLVTGGAGFVGSHVAREAADAGSRVVVLDDLSEARGWPRLPPAVTCVRGDVGDAELVSRLVAAHGVTAVVHLAGRSRVEESVADAVGYIDSNVARTLALLEVVRARGVGAVVFSSSSAVYGAPRVAAGEPIDETARPAPVSPYGATKLAVERVLALLGREGLAWAALRYFNAAGAHPDGSLREAHDPETHLVPRAIAAAAGLGPPVVVRGDDYPTVDGTCARDYVHVLDLARAHLSALDALDRGVAVGTVNLGSGSARTVREVLDAVARVLGRPVPCAEGARRARVGALAERPRDRRRRRGEGAAGCWALSGTLCVGRRASAGSARRGGFLRPRERLS